MRDSFSPLLPQQRQKQRKLFPRPVLRSRSRSWLAFLVRIPFLDARKPQAGAEAGGSEGLQAAMEGGGVHGSRSSHLRRSVNDG